LSTDLPRGLARPPVTGTLTAAMTGAGIFRWGGRACLTLVLIAVAGCAAAAGDEPGVDVAGRAGASAGSDVAAGARRPGASVAGAGRVVGPVELDAGPAAPTPAADAGPATPSPAATTGAATPAPPAPEPMTLEALRATERFLELAPHDRAADAPWARFGWGLFAPQAAGETLFEWSNKAALWDELAPAFRDTCLLAGPEADRPMWDAEVLIPAGAGPAWNDDSTEGRGQFVEFSCVYDDDGAPVERFFGVLITTDVTGAGHVRALMPPFDVRESDYPDFQTSRDGVDAQLWAWVQAQPRAAAD
jgi:hypothetical protein